LDSGQRAAGSGQPAEKDLNNSKSANALWGKVVLALRESKYPALHVACGNLRDITLTGGVLTVNVKEEYIYNLLMGEENLNLLGTLLGKINGNVMLSIKLKTEHNEAEENIIKLKKKFGENLKIEQ